jgi:hypothetical protein
MFTAKLASILAAFVLSLVAVFQATGTLSELCPGGLPISVIFLAPMF